MILLRRVEMSKMEAGVEDGVWRYRLPAHFVLLACLIIYGAGR